MTDSTNDSSIEFLPQNSADDSSIENFPLDSDGDSYVKDISQGSFDDPTIEYLNAVCDLPIRYFPPDFNKWSRFERIEYHRVIEFHRNYIKRCLSTINEGLYELAKLIDELDHIDLIDKSNGEVLATIYGQDDPRTSPQHTFKVVLR